MKKSALLILAVILLAAMSLNVFAAYPDAKKGDKFTVPKTLTAINVDGVKDNAYGQVFDFHAKDAVGLVTAEVRSGLSPMMDDSSKDVYNQLSSQGYMTWDDKNLYFYVELNDPNIVFVTELNYDNRAKGAGFEFQYSTSEKDKAFVIIDEKGNALATTADGRAQKEIKAAGKIISATKFAVELAIPWNFYGTITPKVGAEAMTFGYTGCCRLPGTLTQRLYGFGGCLYRETPLYGVPVVLADAKVEEVKKPAAGTTTTTKAPATADFMGIALVLSMGLSALAAKKIGRK